MRTRDVIALMSFISMETNDVIEGMKTVRVVLKDVPVLTRDVIALMSLISIEMKDFRAVRKDVRVLMRDVIAWIRLISIEMKDVHTRMSDFIAGTSPIPVDIEAPGVRVTIYTRSLGDTLMDLTCASAERDPR